MHESRLTRFAFSGVSGHRYALPRLGLGTQYDGCVIRMLSTPSTGAASTGSQGYSLSVQVIAIAITPQLCQRTAMVDCTGATRYLAERTTGVRTSVRIPLAQAGYTHCLD